VQFDNFTGSLRVLVSQLWDLAAARCRFARYLRVDVDGETPPVAELLREFPVRRVRTDDGEWVQGLKVRLLLQRERAVGELDLGDAARFFPSDAALERWARCTRGGARLVYDAEAEALH
jgi:DNA polymerase-3 subunit alpha